MKKSNYKYQVGEIVNGTLKIVSQTKNCGLIYQYSI
ncbi:hypothetical protein [Staphylococcus phage vB_SsapH-Golestan-105-M]|nr:hypothetical protein [Staphylococcus phage vB_SsapH-Golestan-105-M]